MADAAGRRKGQGNKYLLLTLSDAGGQFVASCFDEAAQGAVTAAASAGTAVLIHGELLYRPGEETPRVTIRSVQPLAQLASRARWQLLVDVAAPVAVDALATLLAGAHGGRSEVLVRLPLAAGSHALVSLGRDFVIDGELRAKVERARGVGAVVLNAAA